jgi:hypothetical protein
MTRAQNPNADLAYQMWAKMPNKTGVGSMKKLSMETGVPVKTLYDWKDRYRWRDRWAADIRVASPELVETGLANLVESWPLVTDRLIDIIANGSDKDASNAIRVYATLVGAQKNEPLAPTGQARGRLKAADVEAVEKLTRDELFAIAQQAGADHMDRALKSRSARRAGDRLANPI